MRIFKQLATIKGDYLITNNIANSDPHMVTAADILGPGIRIAVSDPLVTPDEMRRLVLDKFHQPNGARPNPELLGCWQDAVAGRRALWELIRVSIHYGKIFLEFAKPSLFGKKSETADASARYLDTLMLSIADFAPDSPPVQFTFVSRLVEPFGESRTHVKFGIGTTVVAEITDVSMRTLDFMMPSATQAQTEEYPVEITERTW